MRIAVIVGARPNFIKAAPLLAAWRRLAPRVRPLLIHTGQHYDVRMSDVFFKELRLPRPDVHLGVGPGTHARQTGRILQGVERVLAAKRPDLAVVFGDVNSTLAGALAAAKLRIPVAHIEAGLRSFNRAMPEEINRVLTDHLSTWLFCPTRRAVANLRAEGIRQGVHQVGDVMLDALRHPLRSRLLRVLKLAPKTYALATVHRAENTDDRTRLASIFAGLSGSPLPVIVPLHPRTRRALARLGARAAGGQVRLIDPVSYFDMLWLERHARLILTDSGGVQKEACFLRVPCVTLRQETEWPETIEAGWNELAGANAQEIQAAMRRWHARGYRPRRATRASRMPFGNGHASEKIVKILLASG